MRFTVTTLRRAERDYQRILNYIAARSKPGAAAWAKAFDKALVRLEQNADSCPLAAEDEHVDFEVRKIRLIRDTRCTIICHHMSRCPPPTSNERRGGLQVGSRVFGYFAS